MRRIYSFSITQLVQLTSILQARAEHLEHRHALSRFAAWSNWTAVHVDQHGGRKVHRLIRGPTPWAQFQVQSTNASEDVDSVKGTPQHDADNRAAPWHKLWRTDLVEDDVFSDNEPITDEALALLASTSVQDVRDVSNSFRALTAVGSDSIHPRQLAWLSDAVLAALIGLWTAMLRTGLTPGHAAITLIILLPKVGGGDRPVAILATVVRALSRLLRRSYGNTWIQQNHRDYFLERLVITLRLRHPSNLAS